jgi:hypothetical protein
LITRDRVGDANDRSEVLIAGGETSAARVPVPRADFMLKHVTEATFVGKNPILYY